MKRRLKIYSADSNFGFYFLGLFDPDDEEGISNDIYSVLMCIYPESKAKSESLRIARILKDKPMYIDSNEICYAFREDFVKYIVEFGKGNYFADKDGNRFSNDYRDAFLFLSVNLKEIQLKYPDTELIISDVSKDPNLFNEVCGIMERVYNIIVDDDFINSQKENYFYEITQRCIAGGNSYRELADYIAARMFQDYYDYRLCLALIGKMPPS